MTEAKEKSSIGELNPGRPRVRAGMLATVLTDGGRRGDERWEMVRESVTAACNVEA